jgi:hypothetical protein
MKSSNELRFTGQNEFLEGAMKGTDGHSYNDVHICEIVSVFRGKKANPRSFPDIHAHTKASKPAGDEYKFRFWFASLTSRWT